MLEIAYYKSPIGNISICSNHEKLVGLWFDDQKYYLGDFKNEQINEKENIILTKTKKWLDKYFRGEKPKINELDIEFIGTDFRKKVWKILCEIPYGKTVTYKYITDKIAREKGMSKMSAQAVGQAVGHNPISVIVPCHRVVGTNGNLIGYAGGIERKKFLLKHENAVISLKF